MCRCHWWQHMSHMPIEAIHMFCVRIMIFVWLWKYSRAQKYLSSIAANHNLYLIWEWPHDCYFQYLTFNQVCVSFIHTSIILNRLTCSPGCPSKRMWGSMTNFTPPAFSFVASSWNCVEDIASPKWGTGTGSPSGDKRHIKSHFMTFKHLLSIILNTRDEPGKLRHLPSLSFGRGNKQASRMVLAHKHFDIHYKGMHSRQWEPIQETNLLSRRWDRGDC